VSAPRSIKVLTAIASPIGGTTKNMVGLKKIGPRGFEEQVQAAGTVDGAIPKARVAPPWDRRHARGACEPRTPCRRTAPRSAELCRPQAGRFSRLRRHWDLAGAEPPALPGAGPRRSATA
jgi:hypothetical protein